MKYSVTVKEMIEDLIEESTCSADPEVTMYIGEPGIGKSYAVEAVAEKTGRHYELLSLGMLEPYDIKGMPKDIDGYMRFLAPYFAEVISKHKGKVLLHLDEFNHADLAVQGACYQLIHGKKIDNLEFDKQLMIVLTGNKGGDDGTMSNSVSSAVTNRCAVYRVISPTAKQWIAYEKPTECIKSFLESHPTSLASGPDIGNTLNPWSSARQWSKLSKQINDRKLNYKDSKDCEKIIKLAYGRIDEGDVNKFAEHIRDTAIDPKALFNMEKSAWDKFSKAQHAKRIATLEQVTPLIGEGERKKNNQKKEEAFGKFCKELLAVPDLIGEGLSNWFTKVTMDKHPGLSEVTIVGADGKTTTIGDEFDKITDGMLEKE